LLVLPETALKNAHLLCERLRQKIEKTPISVNGKRISYTASFGVTGFSTQNDRETLTQETLINRADELLYTAKENGRNKVSSGPFDAGKNN
jgi:diguanylate cyclase (GGDEF)-like protein